MLEATIEDGRLRSEEFPDPLARVWSALAAPHAGDFVVSLAPGYEAVDWGGVTHVPGGSHGSLRRDDSLGPLLFVGCGPERRGRARAVDAARRGPGGAGALRAAGAGVTDPETIWHGYQAAWEMARGYEGQFGHKLNAPYVFLPLCAIFLAGLLDWRRPWRVANLDLLVLLAFGVSHIWFNRGEIGVSVPLQYPPLLYLLGPGAVDRLPRRGEGLRPVWPAAWLLIAALFLIGFRVGLNMADSGVIDVGYASEVGANRIAHGEPIYDNFPEDVSEGDTYGPVNYFAYVPFERIWPWSGTWNDLPAAHGAAVFFDLATFALLLFLGRRIRPGPGGHKLGATLAFGWAAYPYTAFALQSNSNDALVAMLLVATLLAARATRLRGGDARPRNLHKVRAGAARADARSRTGRRTRGRLGGGVLDPSPSACRRDRCAVMALADLRPRAEHLLRPDHRLPSRPRLAIQHLGPSPELGAPANRHPRRRRSLSLLLAFRPRRKTLMQVAALGAALLIGLQLTAQHWFYLYIVWFYPLLLVALVRSGSRP